ncbi:MarR family winged helix-turn-helix transcriptional regulator [Bordetella genomosp. 7]|uniref:MarR family winged helix-turn-helix transcriptional regulator n=1 Tax=Bordetella genomosp. 7 TaxID=1416805 RepID=UPI002016795D|nr:MarR family transcriptional regulator [Bordetella genomosp. 7]
MLAATMFEQCLYFNTTSLARKLDRLWSAAFSPFGLTPSQAFLLRMILAGPGRHQSDLAREMNIAPATMSRTLDGLEKLGYVRRQVSSHDPRGMQVFATEKAQSIGQALEAASGSVTRRFKQLLSSEGFDDVVAQIRRVSEALE